MKRAIILLFVFFAAESAQAFDLMGLQPVGPYGVYSTFGADSLPTDKAAVEIIAERTSDPNLSRFALRGSYGLTDSVEVMAGVPYVYNYEGSENGFESVALGIKHRFHDEGKYGPSLAYLVRGSWSGGKREFGTKGSYGAGMIVSKRLGPFQTHLNFFYDRPGTSKLEDQVSFAGGVIFSASHDFKLMAEVLSRKSYFSNDFDLLETRFGYRVQTSENISTTLGIGFDLKKRNPELRFVLSFAFILPPAKKEIKRIYESD